MTCPLCGSAEIRRSRRRTLLDYLVDVVGIVPWRCEACEMRFHARPVAFRFALYARCGICGNRDLQKISPERVNGAMAAVGRVLRVPALRCDPCRHKFFSLRPVLRAEQRMGMPAE
ncbi:MAG TPA: hypothetical protein VOA64_21450 [Candidatus Dormibacteraeota bacterium]|nr:hypothetical protein [Candidatus Dormibacteraeota bacterium]